MKILVTGGAGFIGSAFIRYVLKYTNDYIINVDCLTYAGNLGTLNEVSSSDRYLFRKVNICDREALKQLFDSLLPDAVIHLAAESHVDRSIDGPAAFVETNIIGTYNLLETCRDYWRNADREKRKSFRFHHVSTDEVYGDLGFSNKLFMESTAYDPHSPYSATKASSDHLVRAWSRTYGLPCVISNCSNNYGPFQYPEKLIPLMILNGMEGQAMPVYGEGKQVRDWLYVEDHVEALYKVLRQGSVGSSYNIGGHNEKRNIDVVRTICEILDVRLPKKPSGIRSYNELITYVEDRPGHDLRYAIDASKIERELGWKPRESFESGLRKTVDWYIGNRSWCEQVQSGKYNRERIGIREA